MEFKPASINIFQINEDVVLKKLDDAIEISHQITKDMDTKNVNVAYLEGLKDARSFVRECIAKANKELRKPPPKLQATSNS